MARQIHAVTKMSLSVIEETLDKLFDNHRDLPPFNGRDWRAEGVTMAMAREFAEMHEITLRAHHGCREVPEA